MCRLLYQFLWGHSSSYCDISCFFSEYGHAAYQIKGNEAYDNMLANILLLHLSLTYG